MRENRVVQKSVEFLDKCKKEKEKKEPPIRLGRFYPVSLQSEEEST